MVPVIELVSLPLQPRLELGEEGLLLLLTDEVLENLDVTAYCPQNRCRRAAHPAVFSIQMSCWKATPTAWTVRCPCVTPVGGGGGLTHTCPAERARPHTHLPQRAHYTPHHLTPDERAARDDQRATDFTHHLGGAILKTAKDCGNCS